MKHSLLLAALVAAFALTAPSLATARPVPRTCEFFPGMCPPAPPPPTMVELVAGKSPVPSCDRIPGLCDPVPDYPRCTDAYPCPKPTQPK